MMKVRYNNNYQTLILLFLWLAGMGKAFFNLYVADIDLVLLALVLAVTDVVFHFIRGFKPPTAAFLSGFLILTAFFAYMIISIFYSTSEGYAFIKTAYFLPNMVFFAYAMFIKEINFTLFAKVYAIVLIPLSAFFIYMKSILWTVDSEATRIFMDVRQSYLAIGFHLGLLFFTCLYFLRKFWLLALIFFLLVASSARGALLFAVLTFMVVESQRLSNITIKKKLLKGFVLGFPLLLLTVFLFKKAIYSLLENAIYRFSVFFSEGGGGESAAERVNQMHFAIVEAFSSVTSFSFGHGIGSFGIEYLGVDGRAYPHNLFLEVLFELGFLGLALILVVFLLTFYCSLKVHKLFFALFIFCLLNAMKSFPLTDLWILFSVMGLILNQTSIKYDLQS